MPTPEFGAGESVVDPQHNPASDETPANLPHATNWERLYRERDAQYKDLKSRYDGREGFGQKEKQRADALELQIKNLAQEYEGKLAEVSNGKAAVEAQLGDLNRRVELLDGENQGLKKVRELRSIVKEKYEPLLDAFDAGLMEGAENLEGERLDAYMQKFQAHMEKQQQDLLKGIGTTVPRASGNNAAASADTLYEALMKMPENDPNREAAMEAYWDALDKERK